MRRVVLLCVAAAISVSGGCSNTEGSRPPGSEQQGARAGTVGAGGAGANLKNDADFVQDVAIKNMAAIALSRMALEKAARNDIKSFARAVIDEHEAAGTTLRKLASEASAEWPAQLDEDQQDDVDELTSKQGADFERGYVDAIIEGYQDLTAKLESRLDVQSLAEWKTAAAARTQSKALPEPESTLHDVAIRPHASSTGTTAKINQWAADTYPVAQKHLDTARTLENAAKER